MTFRVPLGRLKSHLHGKRMFPYELLASLLLDFIIDSRPSNVQAPQRLREKSHLQNA